MTIPTITSCTRPSNLHAALELHYISGYRRLIGCWNPHGGDFAQHRNPAEAEEATLKLVGVLLAAANQLRPMGKTYAYAEDFADELRNCAERMSRCTFDLDNFHMEGSVHSELSELSELLARVNEEVLPRS